MNGQSVTAYLVCTLTLEWLSSRAFMRCYLISYKNLPERSVAKAATRSKIPVNQQIWNVLNNLLGPLALLNGAIGFFVFRAFLPSTEAWVSLHTLALEFVALQLIGDFLLYLGHRVQHESEYLWEKHHKLHHTLGTFAIAVPISA